MSMRLPASERRDQLMATALEEFARQGFHATSMNEIADDMDPKRWRLRQLPTATPGRADHAQDRLIIQRNLGDAGECGSDLLQCGACNP